MSYFSVKSSVKVLLGLALTVSFSTGSTAQDKINKKERDALVKYRTLFMKVKNDHNVAIRNLTKKMPISATDRVNQMVTHANALKAMATDMMRLFPAGSGQGKSRTSGEVWDPKTNALSQKFVANAVKMQVAAENLAVTAHTGNMKEIKKQVRNLAGACQTCHKDFRSE